MKRLTKLANKYRTDKGTEFEVRHGFTEFYEDFFLKYEHPVILELGVDKGASERMLNDFFDEDCEIYCVDIDDKTDMFKENDNIKFFRYDLSNRESLKNLIEAFNGVKFDIIIDDASHKWKDQFLGLLFLSSCLKPDGIYVLEDLHTSLSPSFGDYKTVNNSPLSFLTFFEPTEFLEGQEYSKLLSSIENILIYSRYNPANTGVDTSITSIITFK